jgi:Uma2 family endonuclease
MTERVKMTAADYFELPETNRIVELIDGEIIMTPTPVSSHQRIVNRTARLIELLMPNGEMLFAPLGVYLDDVNVLEPDILWVSEANRGIVGDYIHSAPDLVVEVLSPSTSKRDRKDKFELYERFGVREYWIIDPATELVEVWVNQENKFSRQGIYSPDDEHTFASPVLGSNNVNVKLLFDR